MQRLGVDLDIGRYGDDLLLRAVVARIGWGANVPEEAVYPVTRVDAEGAPLDGAHTYRIRFPAGELPPVDAFWSLSAYGADMFFAEHPSGRYTIGDRTPGLELGDDGSLELVAVARRARLAPDGAPVNWLPVPAGPFVLMLRLYLPQDEVLDGGLRRPAVEPARLGRRTRVRSRSRGMCLPVRAWSRGVGLAASSVPSGLVKGGDRSGRCDIATCVGGGGGGGGGRRTRG